MWRYVNYGMNDDFLYYTRTNAPMHILDTNNEEKKATPTLLANALMLIDTRKRYHKSIIFRRYYLPRS